MDKRDTEGSEEREARLLEEVTLLRSRVEKLEIDLNSSVMDKKACEVEANNLRSSCRSLRARVAELEKVPKWVPERSLILWNMRFRASPQVQVQFRCRGCGKKGHADVVGARGILGRSEEKSITCDTHHAEVKGIVRRRYAARRRSPALSLSEEPSQNGPESRTEVRYSILDSNSSSLKE